MEEKLPADYHQSAVSASLRARATAKASLAIHFRHEDFYRLPLADGWQEENVVVRFLYVTVHEFHGMGFGKGESQGYGQGSFAGPTFS
jgi:hypothetical protein